MGGGDDLGGSDDELLWNQPVDDDDVSEASAAAVDDYQDNDESNKKRKKDSSTSVIKSPSKKKKKQHLSPTQLLLQAGRDIEKQDATQQAAFLTTAVKHYSLMQQNDESKEIKILPHYFVRNSSDRLVDCIRNCASAKKMKQWKHIGSPCVLIVCISARRAVTVLKELQSLKVRSAKLFPKNGSVQQQQQQLSEAPFGLAVGTPNRLQQLLTHGDATADATRFNLDRTQLVVIDCYVSNKQYTVCTLPDTAPHCMALIQQAILPQLGKRKDCKMAFF